MLWTVNKFNFLIFRLIAISICIFMYLPSYNCSDLSDVSVEYIEEWIDVARGLVECATGVENNNSDFLKEYLTKQKLEELEKKQIRYELENYTKFEEEFNTKYKEIENIVRKIDISKQEESKTELLNILKNHLKTLNDLHNSMKKNIKLMNILEGNETPLTP